MGSRRQRRRRKRLCACRGKDRVSQSRLQWLHSGNAGRALASSTEHRPRPRRAPAGARSPRVTAPQRAPRARLRRCSSPPGAWASNRQCPSRRRDGARSSLSVAHPGAAIRAHPSSSSLGAGSHARRGRHVPHAARALVIASPPHSHRYGPLATGMRAYLQKERGKKGLGEESVKPKLLWPPRSPRQRTGHGRPPATIRAQGAAGQQCVRRGRGKRE